MRVRMPRLLGVVGGTAALALALAGCGGSSGPTADGPWATELRAAYAAAPTDFVREVLADGEVTSAEVQEALHRANECLAQAGEDGGWFADPNEPTTFGTGWTPEDADPAAFFDCQCLWLGGCDDSAGMDLPNLFLGLRDNPLNVPRSDLIASCLHRHDLVADGFTGNDLVELGLVFELPNPDTISHEEHVRLIERLNPCHTVVDHGDHLELVEIPDCELPPRELPGGIPFDEGQALDCTLDPTI